jgi:hypothetical protein
MAQLNCDFFRARVMSQFHALQDYLKHSEAQIQEGHHAMRAQILSEQRPDDTDDAVEQWISLQQAELDNCDRRFTQLFQQSLRFSVVISTFTLIESNLSRMAGEMCQRLHLNLGMEDLQAKDLVKRFEKFWTRVAILPWWNDPRWEKLKEIEELRNCIAHRRGLIRENEQRIRNLVSRHRGVSIIGINDPLVDPDDAGAVRIEESYCLAAVQEMAGLFKEIFERAGCFGPDHLVVEQ